jgi:dTDP-4-amino-4,6-dideoxygalactose transaminase
MKNLIANLIYLKRRFPFLFKLFNKFTSKLYIKYFGSYPRILSNEIEAVSKVLRGTQWNMAGGNNLVHNQLEEAFAEYVGVNYAVAVNTGGMALQMSMRSLGLKHGDEVILQVDTCSATAMAIMNAGCTPVFSDISEKTFLLNNENISQKIDSNTKAIIASHLWGNPEDMKSISEICESNNLYVIEDACLALGAKANGKMAGASGKVGVYSFGCLKPIQAGEGGMIVTNDEALARELKSLRHWGDRTIDFGVRDTVQLAWNGRMSEIVAAVVNEQIKGYPKHLADLQNAVEEFQHYLKKIEGLDLVFGNSNTIRDCAFTQVVLRLDEDKFGHDKKWFREKMHARGISTWHANFELINSLSFFKQDIWKNWIIKGDIDKIAKNYNSEFYNAQKVYNSIGIGLSKNYFLSKLRLRQLITHIDEIVKSA